MFHEKQQMLPPERRLTVVLCIISLIALGVPVWWHTTKIQRPTLPHQRMQRASASAAGFQLPVSITLHVVGFTEDLDPRHIAEQFGHTFSEGNTVEAEAELAVSVVVRSIGLDGISCTSASWWRPAALRPAHAAVAWAAGISAAAAALCQGPELDPAAIDAWGALGDGKVDDAWHGVLQRAGLAGPGSYHVLITQQPQAAASQLGSQTGVDNGTPAAGIGSSPEELPAQGDGRRVELLLGRRRGAFLRLLPRETGADAAPGAASLQPLQQCLLQALAAAAPALALAFLSVAGSIPAGQQPLSAAGEAMLSFSLCNADPTEHYSTWDFAALERRYLEPMRRALLPAVHLSVESQVLLHTRSRHNGTWSKEHGAFVVKHAKLRSFVDSHWNLNTGGNGAGGGSGRALLPGTHAQEDTFAAASERGSYGGMGRLALAAAALIPRHVLHFVAYVPPSEQRPLVVLLPDGTAPSPTNSFWVPSWGGVHILNPQQQQQQQQPMATAQRCRSSGLCGAAAAAQPLGRADMARFARAVASQLRALLGVAELRERLLQPQPPFRNGGAGSLPPALAVRAVPDAEAAFALWELDVLVRQRAAHNAATAAQVLGSLSRLVEQLPSLEMPDLIGDQVEAALRSLDQAVDAMRAGDYFGACIAAQTARSYAEAAFSNPAVLAQLSFPPSHLVGVYLPFFAPLGMALVQALFTEVGHLRKGLQRRKASPRADAQTG